MTKNIIGFDAKRVVRNGTGLGSYGRTLVNDLAQRQDLELRLYAPDKGRDDLRSQIVERPNVSFCYPHLSSFISHLSSSWWRMKGVVADLQRDGVQLYHGLSGELPIGIHKSGIRSVVTIHDLIFLRHPEFYHWVDTKIYAWKFRQTMKEADHVIAISECTKRDILYYSDIDEQKISIVYQSFAPRFSAEVSEEQRMQVRSAYQLPQRYILNVGSIEARKNILQAVQALPLLPEDVALVIVGRHTPYTDRVLQYVQEHHLEERVRVLHGVPDEHLPVLYALAESFVYPSVYEGFGIPIIEAISCGLPVVACSGSCLEEAGGPDSLYVQPSDVEAMADAIRQTLVGAEGRELRIENSKKYIRRFSGCNVADQVVNVYRSLL
jgi:glycosyltransferase involved in cell wall biosynthesis